MDGIFPTANSARALAARGLVVLQVGEITTDAEATPREPSENGTAGYVAAVERLAAEGVVDPEKVGVIGFSRTGWYVLDSLIHRPELFRVATLAECTAESYYEYLMNADYLGLQRAKGIAEGIGPEPFGPGLTRWISDSPGFNTDKIRVPVLFEEHSPVALVYSWDLYASLRLQGKPVELLYFRNGEHILFKPRQRLASQEMNVDWFDFWLNGHEDPDPAKTDQYVRWRALKGLAK
jgi:dipeptidyl aminopeptidase/acylaminoacyl peptidase